MNYLNINYETEEERNLRKMRFPRTNKQCNHSYVIQRIIQPHPIYFYGSVYIEWEFVNKAEIHLRCEKCGFRKKVRADSNKVAKHYKVGDKWEGIHKKT